MSPDYLRAYTVGEASRENAALKDTSLNHWGLSENAALNDGPKSAALEETMFWQRSATLAFVDSSLRAAFSLNHQ